MHNRRYHSRDASARTLKNVTGRIRNAQVKSRTFRSGSTSIDTVFIGLCHLSPDSASFFIAGIAWKIKMSTPAIMSKTGQ